MRRLSLAVAFAFLMTMPQGVEAYLNPCEALGVGCEGEVRTDPPPPPPQLPPSPDTAHLGDNAPLPPTPVISAPPLHEAAHVPSIAHPPAYVPAPVPSVVPVREAPLPRSGMGTVVTLLLILCSVCCAAVMTGGGAALYRSRNA